MKKQVTKDFNLNIAHIEAAVAAYLKPYFPETADVYGVDITFPVSQRDGTVIVRAYLGPAQGEDKVLPAVPSEPEAANDDKKATPKKVNNKRKTKS